MCRLSALSTRTGLFPLILIIGVDCAAEDSRPRFEQLAISGQPIPEADGGGRFIGFSAPRINSYGDVAFIASVDPESEGEDIFQAVFGPSNGTGSAPAILARTGGPVFGAADGAEINYFESDSLATNDAGDVAFLAHLKSGSLPGAGIVDNTNGEAIVGPTSGAGSALGIIARVGDPVPSAGEGVRFGQQGFERYFSLNSAGDIAFYAALDRITGSEVERDFYGIFGPSDGPDAGPVLIAQTGQSAPGIPGAELLVTHRSLSGPVLNESGNVAFSTLLRNAPGESDFDSWSPVVFATSEGPGSAITPVTGVPSAVADDNHDFSYRSLDGLTMNASGQLAFRSYLRPSFKHSVLASTDDRDLDIHLVIQVGDEAPGVDDGAKLEILGGTPALNDAGDVAFTASVGDPLSGSRSDYALFGPSADPGSPLAVIVREGDLAPGSSDGAVFFGLSAGSSPGIALNNAGDIVFSASLRAGDGPEAGWVNSFNNQGLYAWVDGRLQLIVREWDLFEITEPETRQRDFRRVSQIRFDKSSSSTGLNDSGMLALAIRFTDGTSGVFTVDLSPVPEPCSLAAIVVAILTVGIGYRQSMHTLARGK